MMNMETAIINFMTILIIMSIVYSAEVLYHYGSDKFSETIGVAFSGIYILICVVSTSLYLVSHNLI